MRKQSYVYPGVVSRDEGSDYGIHFPDLPGCISVGRDQSELAVMAAEALEFHLEGMIGEGTVLPEPTRIEDLTVSSSDGNIGIILVTAWLNEPEATAA